MCFFYFLEHNIFQWDVMNCFLSDGCHSASPASPLLKLLLLQLSPQELPSSAIQSLFWFSGAKMLTGVCCSGLWLLGMNKGQKGSVYRAGIISPVYVPQATWIYFLLGRTEIIELYTFWVGPRQDLCDHQRVYSYKHIL